MVVTGVRIKFTYEDYCNAPDLIIEVLSPSTAHRDRTFKRSLYARHGVREFWMADADARSIEVLLLGSDGYEAVATYGAGEFLTSATLIDFTLKIDDAF